MNLLYQWIDQRGYRPAWNHTVRFKRKLHEEALSKGVKIRVPYSMLRGYHRATRSFILTPRLTQTDSTPLSGPVRISERGDITS